MKSFSFIPVLALVVLDCLLGLRVCLVGMVKSNLKLVGVALKLFIKPQGLGLNKEGLFFILVYPNVSLCLTYFETGALARSHLDHSPIKAVISNTAALM